VVAVADAPVRVLNVVSMLATAAVQAQVRLRCGILHISSVDQVQSSQPSAVASIYVLSGDAQALLRGIAS
jgi:hypothetical protein